MSEWIEIIVSILSGLAVTIPLVIKLVEYVRKAVQEKNWAKLVELIMVYMADAEKLFTAGEERKQYVLMASKASADVINYSVDMEQIGELIDQLCAMSKFVNAPKDNIEETQAGA